MKRILLACGLVLVLIALPLAAACAKPAPTPAPAPKPAPAPAPAPAPTPAPAPKPAEKFTLTFATTPGTSTTLLPFVGPSFRYQKLVEEASGGRLVLDTKIGAVPDAEVAMAVRDGRFDMGRFYPAWISGTFPLWDYASLPFFFDTIYDYERATKDPKFIEVLEKSFGGVGLVPLLDAASDGNPAIWSNKPITTVADFKGLKVRSAGLLYAYTMELLGAAPLTIATAEISEAMRRGTVDAIHTDRIWAFTVGMTDVAKYLNLWRTVVAFGNIVVINKKKFESLPTDLQQSLRQASRQMAGEMTYATDFGGQFGQKAIELAGVKVNIIDEAERAKARQLIKQPVIDKWLGVAGPLGPEMLKVLSNYATK